MSDNQKIKIKNNLQINFHNHISKPSYLITINPDKFLQKSTYNTAMSIKERDEINPEMAEIVRKILLKKKKEKNKKQNNYHSVNKGRKIHSLKKCFDNNHKKTVDMNKDNKESNNNTIILDSLLDRVGANNNKIKYFDYINNSVKNKIKIIRKKKLDICDGLENRSLTKYKEKNYIKSNIPQNKIRNHSYIQKSSYNKNSNTEYRPMDLEINYNKKSNSSLNLEKNDEYLNNKVNEEYTLEFNSLFDDDKINKDENIMEIKCDYSYNEFLSPKKSFKKEMNKSEKKRIYFKKYKFNYLDDKNLIKESPSINKAMSKNLYNNNIPNNKYPLYRNQFNEKNKLYNKKNHANLIEKMNKIKERKNILNTSLELRNTNNLLKPNNINNTFNLTIANNAFKNNFKISNITNNINNINNLKKKGINLSVGKREKNSSEEKRKMNNKKIKNKNSYKIIPKNINIINSTKKSSPFHSKNSSNISTELSRNNNKKNSKIKINNINKPNELGQKSILNNKKNLNDYNKTTHVFMKNKIKQMNVNIINKTHNRKIKSKTNISIRKDYQLNKNDKNFLNNQSKKSLFNQKNSFSQKSNKKEYPNMAHIQNREIKYIKHIESLCKKGYSGPGIKKTNQDNFFIYNNFNNNSNYVYLGVCDGHGIFGQDISTYLVNNLPQKMNKKVISKNVKNLSNADISLLTTIFQETFVETNISLNSDERIDSSYSGSTCVSLLFTPSKVFCINVGDSRCILGKFLEKDKNWISYHLSRDHKPSEPDEMLRIKKYGGIVESYRDNFGNFVGPERVWGTGLEGPGLAMSRSFGDEMGHGLGIVVDPEILEHFFEKEDKFIVLASDGIWEFLSNEEVVNIVQEYYLENNVEGAIEHLYNEAAKRWIMEEGVVDDITIIIMFLN